MTDFTETPTPSYNTMELLTPKILEIGILGKDGRSYKCKVETTRGESNITVDPMYSGRSTKLDLNDIGYLEWQLTSLVNSFIDRYADTTTPRLVKQIQTLVETTVITNHFDYLALAKELLVITKTILDKETN